MSSQHKKAATGSRFVLPALNLNFGSITDGTDIPPPPESPIEPNTPSKTSKGSNESTETNDKTATAYENKVGVRSVAENAPPSPAASGRQDSITQESGRSIVNAYRPASQSGSSAVDSEKTRRASGWFKRLRSGDNQSRRRSSLLGLEQHIPAAAKLTSDKPPPKIPQLVHLESDKGTFGSNLFDHIK
ncbi:uncharacterized protein TRIVIDRAFT_57553 [Trichoderma virens Gv29-8]|uniref:Uncharacterized protein n=1 Tax=Hypocrea virens (strain Gv29-8 / FGSC 10586) TaxID=413071 RepID=G9N2Y1_HYPVG|nr:uncharacterized protein TRIVIDRAFT_57553 [Trichoderma virens Gv29-8]EHK18666.1 hypothetical protein TRIVIDRAFT_57553 [Trichoderma virens Gv29-8]UKZ56445.1 hypothetical protein TrVGV298_010281 [Trichoderma virens]